MPIRLSGASARDPRSSLLLDLCEEFDGLDGRAVSSQPAVINRASGEVLSPLVPLLTNSSGTATVIDAAAGRRLSEITSGATPFGRAGSAYGIPTWQRFQDAASLPVTERRPLRRYTFTIPAKVLVQGTAFVEVGVSGQPGNMTAGASSPGYVWCSQGALNAGRWTPRYRLTTGGAIVNGPDLAIDPTVWHTLGFRYTEGLSPLFEWLVDSVPRYTLTGDAFASQVINSGYFLGAACSAPIGTTYRTGEARYVVEELR